MKQLLFIGLLLLSVPALAQDMAGECPFGHGSSSKTAVTERREAMMQKTPPSTNKDWWPNQLNLNVLRQLWPALHPYGMAQCGHLPVWRWPGWFPCRAAAVCASQ